MFRIDQRERTTTARHQSRLGRRDVLRLGVAAGAGAMFTTTTLSACGAGASGNALARARESGTIKMGFNNEAPYAFVDRANKVTGGFVEVARKVMANLGVRNVEGVLTPFSSLIPALQARRFDVITGMGIKPERCDRVTFADPIMGTREVFALRVDSPLRINSFEDVARQPIVRLALDPAGVERGYATRLGVRESQLVLVTDTSTWAEVVTGGRADAFVATTMTIKTLVDKSRNALRMTEPFRPVIDGEPVTDGYAALAFRAQDRTLRDAFSEEMRELMKRGDVAEIMGEFGFPEADIEDALNYTAKQLCAPRQSNPDGQGKGTT